MTVYRVWAPAAARVEVQVDGNAHRMAPDDGDWWVADLPGPGPGAGVDYSFRLDGGDWLPDPRSPWQPAGVSGPSRGYAHDAFAWTDAGWRGIPLAGSVIYELHIGTFTPAGTFDAAIERLDHLTSLGVDAVELMPVAAFPGERGWGYDGIGLWAVHEPYGGPDGLKRFVDACHGRGLAVLLDVVYNHVGAGSRLPNFGPYFTDVHSTPWGPAVNLDQPGSDEVRAFVIENALMWLRDYHLDGLRLDAVHELSDHRALHVLEELSVRVQALSAALGRELLLIAESDRNDPRVVTAREAGGYGLDAQWNDDFHHAVHAAVTGERQGYYADFGSMGALAKTLTRVFFHDGTWSSFRGRTHGRPADLLGTPAHRFLGYIQDHDQVGNRALGDRISDLVAPGLVKVAAGLVLTAPFTPMLFMGEEWGADTPWQYFADHPEKWLAKAVSDGRRAEFAAHGWNATDVPDPQVRQTFLRSKLDWSQQSGEPHAELLAWYRELIALRHARPELTDPWLAGPGRAGIQVSYDEEARWLVTGRGGLLIVASLAEVPLEIPIPARPTAVLAASRPGVRLAETTVSMPAASFAVLAS